MNKLKQLIEYLWKKKDIVAPPKKRGRPKKIIKLK